MKKANVSMSMSPTWMVRREAKRSSAVPPSSPKPEYQPNFNAFIKVGQVNVPINVEARLKVIFVRPPRLHRFVMHYPKGLPEFPQRSTS